MEAEQTNYIGLTCEKFSCRYIVQSPEQLLACLGICFLQNFSYLIDSNIFDSIAKFNLLSESTQMQKLQNISANAQLLRYEKTIHCDVILPKLFN